MLRALGLKVQHADGSRCARLFSEYYSTFQVGALWAELYREGAFMRNGDEKFELWFSLAVPAGSQLYEGFLRYWTAVAEEFKAEFLESRLPTGELVVMVRMSHSSWLSSS